MKIWEFFRKGRGARAGKRQYQNLGGGSQIFKIKSEFHKQGDQNTNWTQNFSKNIKIF